MGFLERAQRAHPSKVGSNYPFTVARRKRCRLWRSTEKRRSNFPRKCMEAAGDLVRVLSWLGSLAGSRSANITWHVIDRACGPQKNGDDCGVFVAACAASVVLDTNTPLNVDNYRLPMASQVTNAVKEEEQDWARNSLTCTSFS